MSMVEKISPAGFGLIVIGTEILDGRVRDSHFENTRRLLQERNHPLVYAMILRDDPELIRDKLRWAMTRPEPFFCCGGIGDAGRLHPSVRGRGGRCSARVPRGGAGDPQGPLRGGGHPFAPPDGRISRGGDPDPQPGESDPRVHDQERSLPPGFPSMAEPMAAWVLDSRYAPGEMMITRTLVLPGAREGDLVTLMEAFTAAHPTLNFSSLPHYVASGTEVDLGLTGRPEEVEAGISDLTCRLAEMGRAWKPKN